MTHLWHPYVLEKINGPLKRESGTVRFFITFHRRGIAVLEPTKPVASNVDRTLNELQNIEKGS